MVLITLLGISTVVIAKNVKGSIIMIVQVMAMTSCEKGIRADHPAL